MRRVPELAEQIADGLEPEELRRLMYYLIDTVLERPTETPLPVFPVEILTPLAGIAGTV